MNHGLIVNRKRVQRLRRLLAIETLYPKRNLSLANQKHKVYPYLLRGLDINRPNQVWSTDITYSTPGIRREQDARTGSRVCLEC